MSPQQRTQIQARLAKVESERNTETCITPLVIQPVVTLAEALEAAFDGTPVPSGTCIALSKPPRYKLGQAAYMREYRARKAAK